MLWGAVKTTDAVDGGMQVYRFIIKLAESKVDIS